MSESNVKEMRIIVAGGRDFNDYSLLSEKLMDYLEDMDNKDVIDNHNQVKFISGTARGQMYWVNNLLIITDMMLFAFLLNGTN